jgi:hypothetical protein
VQGVLARVNSPPHIGGADVLTTGLCGVRFLMPIRRWGMVDKKHHRHSSSRPRTRPSVLETSSTKRRFARE